MNDLFELTNLEDMANSTMEWHQNMAKRFMHFTTIPAGTEVEIDSKEHILEGDLLLGFITGMLTAYEEFTKNPPFTVKTND